VLLFKASEAFYLECDTIEEKKLVDNVFSSIGEDNGWNRFVRNLKIIQVANANHFNLTRGDNCKFIAEHISSDIKSKYTM